MNQSQPVGSVKATLGFNSQQKNADRTTAQNLPHPAGNAPIFRPAGAVRCVISAFDDVKLTDPVYHKRTTFFPENTRAGSRLYDRCPALSRRNSPALHAILARFSAFQDVTLFRHAYQHLNTMSSMFPRQYPSKHARAEGRSAPP